MTYDRSTMKDTSNFVECPVCKNKFHADGKKFACSSCESQLVIVKSKVYTTSKKGSLHYLKIVLVALCVISFIGASLQENTNESRFLLITTFFSGVFFLTAIVEGFVDGSLQVKGSVVIVDDNPILFSFGILFYGFLAWVFFSFFFELLKKIYEVSFW